MILDKKSYMPLYRQLYDYLVENIKEGRWQCGSRIPSELELSDQFQISRNTVREAIKELEKINLIYRIRGKGTFVSSSKLEQKLNTLTGFSEDVRAIGMVPSYKNIQIQTIQAPPIVSEKLNLPLNSKVLFLHRLGFADNTPFIIAKTYLNMEWLDSHRISISEKELKDGSLYELLEKGFNVSLNYSNLLIYAKSATKEEAEILGCRKGSPLLVSERVTHLLDDTLIEYNISVGHCDRHRWTTTIYRK